MIDPVVADPDLEQTADLPVDDPPFGDWSNIVRAKAADWQRSLWTVACKAFLYANGQRR